MQERKEKARQLIQLAYQLLAQEGYTQITTVNKLRSLKVKIAAPTFSNIIKGKNSSLSTLLSVEVAIQTILKSELGLTYDVTRQQFIATESPADVLIIPEKPSIEQDPWFGINPHWDGRPDLEHKINFIATAQKEIVEVGVRLNAFTNYFSQSNDRRFTDRIKKLFEQGVTLKLFLLAPDSNEASHYFSDRKNVFPDEGYSTEVIKTVIRKLTFIQKEFSKKGFGEQFQVYTYRHLPHNHFLIIDGATRHGQMMVSHYLYGIKRANAPVIEFNKSANHHLFQRYWKSYQLLTEDAKRII